MESAESKRPTWPERMFIEARNWSDYSTCVKRRVGAVIFTPTFQVLSTGYNDTPMNWTDCGDGGCDACSSTAGTGEAARNRLDCNCVHAEMNAICLAARNGCKLDGNFIISTFQPCDSCRKHIHQAGLAVFVPYGWEYAEDGWLRRKA